MSIGFYLILFYIITRIVNSGLKNIVMHVLFIIDIFFLYNSRCFVILKLRDQYIKLSRISLLNSGGSVLSGGLCSEF